MGTNVMRTAGLSMTICAIISTPFVIATVAYSSAPKLPDPPPYVAPPKAPDHFTKIEFDNYVYGKTKAQIRTLFGSPLVVHDNDDSWYYSDLPIYDAEAGIQVDVRIQFSGIDGPDDTVAAVSY